MMSWDGYDDLPVAALLVEFCMPDIERYTGIGCPCIHLQLHSTVMRGHRLDEAQMIMLFPLSLSGVAQRWFALLDPSRRRTWADLGQEFIRQYSFNTVVDVSRRELEALRQGSDESVTSLISRWREKIAQIIDRPSERDQISTIMRSLQPCFARHLMGFPQTDFGSLVQALYGIEEGISKGHRSAHRPLFQSQILCTPYQMIQHGRYRPVAPIRPAGTTYLHPPPQLVYATQAPQRPPMQFHHQYRAPPPPRPSHRAVQIVTRSGRVAQPPPVDRPFAGIAAREEVQRENDEILRQLRTTQARISIWSLLASSSTHRDALVRALGQITVDTTTTPEGLIHMLTADRATCIVFSDDDLPLEGSNHVRPLFIDVVCSGRLFCWTMVLP
ncbi:hypothetical protein VitviT2T_018220 [Vitis vinifera]|uniref:Retrotransposon gag domain-containing protein n=1 Tax=Vitis vinifera TaxID=29760 RepID=A0ABY9CYT3_VITVI|nr:hypothetical protein VitviT2T_018220 [Vitis vinifera]